MKKSNNILIAALLTLGLGGMAHADVTGPNPQWGSGNDPQSAQLHNAKVLTTEHSRIQNLEARIESLETQINTLFHRAAYNEKAIQPEAIPYNEETIQAMKKWSTEDHLSRAQEKMVNSEELKAEIQRVQSRIDRFSQKPYLDTKGFKRDGLKRLMGNLKEKLQEETAKLAWHKTQAQQTMASTPQSPQAS